MSLTLDQRTDFPSAGPSGTQRFLADSEGDRMTHGEGGGGVEWLNGLVDPGSGVGSRCLCLQRSVDLSALFLNIYP